MDEKTIQPVSPATPEDITKPPELVEELSIFELDERLEFVAWCDNCDCTSNPPK